MPSPGIHRTLARQIADLLAQCASSCGIVIGLFLSEGKFWLRAHWLPRDLFVLREFWLAADTLTADWVRPSRSAATVKLP